MSLEFELVTPEKLLVSARSSMVVLPAAEGEMGVLKNHAPVIAALKPGVVRIYDKEVVSSEFFVSGGFVEITGERCTILAEEAVNLKDVSLDEAKEMLSEKAKENSA